MNTHLSSPRRSFAIVAAAVLLAALVAGCAQAPGADDVPGSGSSVPPQIDYHGFPYNIPAG